MSSEGAMTLTEALLVCSVFTERRCLNLQLTMRLFSPRALLVHIMRFDADNQKNKAKIHLKDSLPLASLHIVDPDDAVDDEDHVNCYHLCGVISHVGENVDSGHYTAITNREEQCVGLLQRQSRYTAFNLSFYWKRIQADTRLHGFVSPLKTFITQCLQQNSEFHLPLIEA